MKVATCLAAGRVAEHGGNEGSLGIKHKNVTTLTENYYRGLDNHCRDVSLTLYSCRLLDAFYKTLKVAFFQNA